MSDEVAIYLPKEPCIVISDGDLAFTATDRTCEQVRQYALSIGPIARAVLVARLRAIADHVATSVEADQ